MGPCKGSKCALAGLGPLEGYSISTISAPALCGAYGAIALSAQAVELVGNDSNSQREAALRLLGQQTVSSIKNLRLAFSRGDCRILSYLIGAGGICVSLETLYLVEGYSKVHISVISFKLSFD